MRAHKIVFLHPCVNRSLICCYAACNFSLNLPAEVCVHSLMRAVLRGGSGICTVGAYPKIDPPCTEPGESQRTAVYSKRNPVVASDYSGHTIALE